MDSSQINNLAGKNWCYQYKILEALPDDHIKKYINRTREKFSTVAKSFDNDKNTEWLIRSYLALKYILAATVFGTSAQQAKEHNLKITLPYLSYYMMLNCCRSFTFSLPNFDWKAEKSIVMSQKKIINFASGKLLNLDTKIGKDIKSQLEEAKSQRELFSYRFPANGFTTSEFETGSLAKAIYSSQLFADLTQLNLECLEASIDKYCEPPFGFNNDEVINLTSSYSKNGERLFDPEDIYRVNYFMRKTDRPHSIFYLAKDGLLEDFFGAWSSEDEIVENEGYDPDRNWSLLISLM